MLVNGKKIQERPFSDQDYSVRLFIGSLNYYLLFYLLRLRGKDIEIEKETQGIIPLWKRTWKYNKTIKTMKNMI